MAGHESKPSRGRQIAWLIGWIAVCFAAAGIGGTATSTSVASWYPELTRPTWTPPDAVFGPVWTVLYFLMAVSAWLVWRTAGWFQARHALGCFTLQLGLNVAWSVIFFGLRQPGWAFAEILVLWLAIVATIVLFWRHSRTAAVLMTPYLAWSSFAAMLNYAIWQMNVPG